MHLRLARFFFTLRPLVSAGKLLNKFSVVAEANNWVSSDVHFWKTGRIGSLVFEGDCIIGHEAAGVVIQVGEDVDNFKPGECDTQKGPWKLQILMRDSRRSGGC